MWYLTEMDTSDFWGAKPQGSWDRSPQGEASGQEIPTWHPSFHTGLEKRAQILSLPSPPPLPPPSIPRGSWRSPSFLHRVWEPGVDPVT